MIVKASQGQKRAFKGVEFDVLAVGLKSMVTKMRYDKGVSVPFHSHPNEQSGYVLFGEVRLRFGEYDEILKAGDSYSIPAEVEHSLEALEQSEAVDVFVPPREDYL
ncbi:MAG: cupin domain-containing protein [Deltaproteobacteria bacterium]|nr:cupin domain-containing protein [Deltaproteobacteria bacterium]